jgi:hypothetical protein
MLSSTNIDYEFGQRARGISAGGIGMIHMIAQETQLIDNINHDLHLLRLNLPYYESDHVLNIAYNILAGGTRMEHIELRRNDEVFLDALGASRIPDPTTARDFCQRFAAEDIEILMNAINRTRLNVWRQQPKEFFEHAVLDADGTIAETTGECKQGMDIAYNGKWGFHPLVISLANTAEPLFLVNRPGNAASHQGAAAYFDRAIGLCRDAGFKTITLRGDTDFSQTTHLDRWDEDGVRFIFGYDAQANLVKIGDTLPRKAWKRLRRRRKYEAVGPPRCRPENVKEQIVIARGFENVRLINEDVAEFTYSPTACKKRYRMIVVRKRQSVTKGQQHLFDKSPYLFYITNDVETSASKIVFEANGRCNQENLIKQLKTGVKAMDMPSDNLVSNWAYMVMGSLAWTLKTWAALLLPEGGRWNEKHQRDKAAVLRMEFSTFVNAFIQMPCQIIHTGRRIIYRLLSWNPWQHVFFRLLDCLHARRQC